MDDLIQAYLDDKILAWSPNTLRSEKGRLKAIINVLDGDPVKLWKAIEDRKPYTRVTIWTRVCDFWKFLVDKGIKQGNEYEQFRQKNQKAFKNTYQPRRPECGFEDAVRRIRLISNDSVRKLALQAIGSGTRWAETIQRDNEVIGKGSKLRAVYRPEIEGSDKSISYSTYRRALRGVNLTPHDLRKLFASKLVEEGAKEADLLKLMGWTSITTAKYYLQPKRDAELKELVGGIHEQIYGSI